MHSVKKSAKILQSKITDFPQLLITLGSGWNKVLDQAQIEQRLDYGDLFGVEASVPGHKGELVIAQVKKKRVAFMSGRFHTYEGYSAEEVTRPIQVFAQAGLKKLILTAASGALHEKYKVGDFVLTSDLLTLFLSLDNPLQGPKFLDMSQVFDQDMRTTAREIFVQNQIKFHEGVYAYYHGPNYETPVDKMGLKKLGADVVGMSTVPEAMMAHWLKLRVMSLAFVTNLAFVKHDHREVVRQAETARQQMVTVLAGMIEREG